MKHIEVVAAIIQKDNKIFITQRGYGEFKDKWEFPGGKIEQGETKEAALKREIKEELNADIEIKEFVDTVNYDYISFFLTMHSYLCTLKSASLELLEAEDAKFIDISELSNYDFLPADKIVIEDLKKLLIK